MEKHEQGLRMLALPDADTVAERAADMIADLLARKPDASIVFPTGKTPLPLYKALRQRRDIDWRRARMFQLDEYLPPANGFELACESFAGFLNRELWQYVNGTAYSLGDYVHNPQCYEDLLTQNGGPDLVILGIGGNGHVAFNEPGTPVDSEIRRAELSEQTRLNNFGDRMNDPGMPTWAITLGLKNILEAGKIVLLATGTAKRAIIQRAFDPQKAPDIECPASWLKTHPDVTVLTDFTV